ncbi:MAG: TraB/VirB10 family protein [Pseudomonadota bacterium]
MALELTPGVKRWSMVGGAVLALLGISWILTGKVEQGVGKAEAKVAFDGVISPGDTRQTSLEGLAAQLKAAQARLDRMERAERERERTERNRLDDRLKTLRAELLIADEVNRESLQRDIRKLEDARAVLDGVSVSVEPVQPVTAAKPASAATTRPSEAAQTSTDRQDRPEQSSTERPSVEPAIYTARPLDARSTPASREEIIREVFAPQSRDVQNPAPGSNTRAGQGPALGGPIRTIRAEVAQAASGPGPGGSEVQLPAGSILTGVLLNGLDAPAGSQSSRDPLPVLVRIKHEALLPSHFTANLAECFVLLAVHGELSSERAMMRGEELSCIMADGTVVQQDLAAYAVGEDGKVGLRGRVVSKQGAFLGNALIVGALQAASDAVSRGSDIAIGAGSGGGTSGGGLTSSITVGASQALDRIAEWYLGRADELFPVVEVDPGRRIDLVLTTGMTFRVEL